MKTLSLTAAVFALAALSGCVTPVGPVEVTRFHTADIAQLGRGTISIVPAPGMDGNSLEYRSYAAAVSRELALLGYAEPVTGAPPSVQIAELRIGRETYRPGRNGSPVSVGVGGSTGSYGSGVGVGIGFDLSGPPPEQVETRLGVTIKDRTTGAPLWEGRASFTVKAKSPLAGTQLGAPKIAEALFKGFPGQSGETIQVK